MRKFNPTSISAILAISAVGVGICKTAPAGVPALTMHECYMGKRFEFRAIREADFYPTPRACCATANSVSSWRPHIRRALCRRRCLVRHLEGFGLRCVYAGDIRTGQDALELDYYGGVDCIITNPPYTRPTMHRLIEHFRNIRPTWLLLDADWAHTRQASPFLPRCSDIVAIGRVKWIEGSKHTGKDNCAWYRFDIRHNAGPVFHGRDQSDDNVTSIRRTGICEQCRKAYEPQRSSSRFCSQTCRQRAHRNRLSVTSSVTPAPSEDSSEVFRYVRSC